MSLIQAPGTGSVQLVKGQFSSFHSLVGLEIKGYSDPVDIFEISGDCFADLVSLTYLSLDTVVLQHTSVENQIHDRSSKFVRINYTFNDVVTNEITSQILIIKDNQDGEKENVIPYSEYKSTQKEKVLPLDPTFRVAFTGLPRLQHLRISGCNLQDISWDMFYKLDNLKFLLLDENDLLFLPDFVFYATSNLSALSVSRNRILNLQTVGLAGLLYLRKLDVTYNNITHLSELSLPPFPHLEVADFRYNPISSIFPNTFEIMNSTKTLYLGSDTTPLDLSPNSFYGLTSLNKLDITNVKIRMLEKTMLKGIPRLKTLIMTGDIPKISYDAFGEVTKLEQLTLRNCGITKISMDAFFGLGQLRELDLSYNSLSFLPPGIFEDQDALKEVFLQHNQLTTLPSNIVQNLPVKILRLEGNPWHCSCDMAKWNPQIINRVKRYHIPAPNNTLCQKVYDKGSMCFETYEPKFEVTYSYEKRVSPICETPYKFNRRSVFMVLKKELRYCSQRGKNVTGNEKGGNTQDEPTPTILPIQNFPDNYSMATLAALEKQLRNISTDVHAGPEESTGAALGSQREPALTGTSDGDEIDNHLSAIPPNPRDSDRSDFISIVSGNSTDLLDNRVPKLEHPEVDDQRQTSSADNSKQTTTPTTLMDKVAWLNSKAQKKKNKKKNRPAARTSNNVGGVQPSTISKKAQKLFEMVRNTRGSRSTL